MENKRITAVKTRIKYLVAGQFVKQEGMEPNYILTPNGRKLSRVRIMATIVDKFISDDKKFAATTVDDGSETIRLRTFGGSSLIEKVSIGDIVDVFGKIREYNGEIYVIPEIIRKTGDPNMEILRELELRAEENTWNEKRKIIFEYQNQVSDLEELKRVVSDRFGFSGSEVEAVVKSADTHVEEGEEKEKVLLLIGQLDKGDGCDYTEIVSVSGLPEDVIDSIINDLLSSGECFEPRPGKIKKL